MSSFWDTLWDIDFQGVLAYVLSWVAPLLFVALLVELGKIVYKRAKEHWVEGKPNEWVVIMRNGEEVKSGVGLATFRSPFDSVAKFKSELVKVEVRTQQVTQEMQGLEVSSMIEWTVDKNYPLKAYKNLDLASGSYHNANETLRAMTSAIVRNQIANSTIDHIIKNRQTLREAVLAEMNSVVQGWGVYLATVEVTDVKILSSQLFKDMQTKFREDNNKKATLEKMCVENSIYFERLEKNMTTNKRNVDTRKITEAARHAEEIEKVKLEIGEFRKKIEITKKQLQRVHAKSIEDKEKEKRLYLKQLEIRLANAMATTDKDIVSEQAERELKQQRLERQKAEKLEELSQHMQRHEAALARKQANYDLLKEGFKDEVTRKLQYLNAVEDLYRQIKWNSFHINQMGDQDPVDLILSKFTKMAEMGDASTQ